MKEKVIFRKGKSKDIGEYFMALFPDDEANPCHVCYVDLWKEKDGLYTFDCYDEIHKLVLWRSTTKIVHKNDPIVPELIDALRRHYGGDYQACEKIVKGMRAY